MSSPRQRIIIKVNLHRCAKVVTAVFTVKQVFRKYSHSLGPEALEYVEEILDTHEIPEQDVEYAVEWIAKEYNKQDGEYLELPGHTGDLMKLRCTYEGIIGCSTARLRSLSRSGQQRCWCRRGGPRRSSTLYQFFRYASVELVAWERRFRNVRIGPSQYSAVNTNISCRSSSRLTVSGSADSRIMAMRNRLNIIKQTVLRNDHFSPSTLPSRDRQHLLTVCLSPWWLQISTHPNY